MYRTDAVKTWRWLPAFALMAAAAAALADAPASHLGVASCASGVCHGSARPLEATPVLQNEYVTWSHFDPHSGAYRTLRTEESARMGQRLGIGAPEREPLCLSCHAENPDPGSRGPRFQLDDGVGCEACHGSSGRWIASHDDRPAATHTGSVALGLVALERADVRATTCAACHVGSRDRFAGHALMAAGHPRLVFELDTYSELWRTSGGREHFRRDGDYQQRKNSSSSIAFWLAGLLESARRTLELTRSERLSMGILPEFSLFNCYSCHRSMRLRRFRDQPGIAPGSLRVNDSSLVMLAAALDGIDAPRAARLRDSTAGLRRAAARGMPALVEAAALLLGELPQLQRELAARNYGPADRSALLHSVLAAAERGDYPDYAAAEQAAMAVTMLLAESGLAVESNPEVEALFADLRDDERFDAERFGRILARIRSSPAR
jgi:Cytochrome c554 and c-prime